MRKSNKRNQLPDPIYSLPQTWNIRPPYGSNPGSLRLQRTGRNGYEQVEIARWNNIPEHKHYRISIYQGGKYLVCLDSRTVLDIALLIKGHYELDREYPARVQPDSTPLDRSD